MTGKAMGGGFILLSGVLLRSKIFDAIAKGSGGLAHGHTFQVCMKHIVVYDTRLITQNQQAHAVAFAAALEVQRIIRDEDVLKKCPESGPVVGGFAQDSNWPLESVGDIPGRGLFWAVEFAQDRKSKTPFPREHETLPQNRGQVT